MVVKLSKWMSRNCVHLKVPDMNLLPSSLCPCERLRFASYQRTFYNSWSAFFLQNSQSVCGGKCSGGYNLLSEWIIKERRIRLRSFSQGNDSDNYIVVDNYTENDIHACSSISVIYNYIFSFLLSLLFTSKFINFLVSRSCAERTYSQLSLRRRTLGPALSARLREMYNL